MYGWCTENLCYISFAVTGETEPAPPTSEQAITPMAVPLNYYYCCDIYPPGNPYQETVGYNNVVVVVGEKEKRDMSVFTGDQYCEWDSENQRFRLYLTSGEPASAGNDNYGWYPEVLLMSQ